MVFNVLKVKEIAQMLGLKKHTLLYHIRTKEDIQNLFEIDVKDNGYCIDVKNAQILINRLLEDNIISEEVFNSALKVLKVSVKSVNEDVKGGIEPDTSDTDKQIRISMLEAEVKHLNELLKAVKSENDTVKEELKEKNSQINRLIEENHINQQLMIQYQIERNRLIEYKSDDSGEKSQEEFQEHNHEQEQKQNKLKWWQKLFR